MLILLDAMAVDPNAFRKLRVLIGLWLALFILADGVIMTLRQVALRFGVSDTGVAVGTYRNRVAVKYDGVITRQYVSWPDKSLRPGRPVVVHILPRTSWAFLDDDYGHSKWKFQVFGVLFAGLWAWAFATYRFG